MWRSFLLWFRSSANLTHRSQRARQVAPNGQDKPQLHEAVASGDPCRVSALLEAGHDPNALAILKAGLEGDSEPHTPLFYAATAGNLAVTQALKRAGAECTARELQQLQRAVKLAAVMLNLEAIHSLRLAGAELGPSSEELYANAWGGDVAAVQCWVMAGAALAGDQLARGGQELLAAVVARDLPRVERWLAAGLDPKAVRDAEDRTLLQLAAGHPEMSKALVEMPMQFAAEKGHAEGLKAMLRSGAAAGMDPTTQAKLLAASLEAGVRGDWLAALVPEGWVHAEHLLLWISAAFAGQPQQGRRWVRCSLLSLGRCGLPGEVAQRVVALALLA